jgi:hypothetical protein
MVNPEQASTPGPAATREALLLGRDAPALLGCVAVRAMAPGAAKIERPYVRTESRGRGAGRAT